MSAAVVAGVPEGELGGAPNFSLTTGLKQLRKEIIAFAKSELDDNTIIERDEKQQFAFDLWRKCGEWRLQGLAIGKDLGGLGLDALSTAVALEGLGYACPDRGLAFSICAHMFACSMPIARFGSDEQKRKYFPHLCDGSLIAVNAMTEPGSGSDAFAMKTTALAENGGFRITGFKTLLTNAPIAGLAVLYAMTDPARGYHGGVTAFIVDRNTPGYTCSESIHKMGLRTAMMGELRLDNLWIPESAVLGKVGGGSSIFTYSMEWERACLGGLHVGLMEWLLERCIHHARTRKAYGEAIGKFQGVSHKIADMKVRLEASRILLYRAASSLMGAQRSAATDICIGKLFVSESLVESARDAVQIFGGHGFLTRNEIERAFRDSTASTLYSGSSEIQRNIVARWLGL